MKKLVIAAAALAAGIAFADADGIVSSTIVGYNTAAAPAAGTYKAMAVQFDNIGESVAIPIKNLITVAAPRGAAGAIATADQIWLWDTTSGDWVKYYYRKVGTQAAVGWCKSGEQVETTDTITSGQTFFFRRGGGGAATTITLAGQVKTLTAQPQYTGIVAGTYQFLCYPWPVDLPIAGFEAYQGAPKGAAGAIATADQIWLWDTANGDWVKYYYRKVGTQAAVGWCKAGETAVTEDSIPAGTGFFFRRGGGGATDTITFTYGN